MRTIFVLIISLLATTCFAGTAPVTMTFDIPVELDPTKVYIHFVNTSNQITGTYRDTSGQSQTLELNKAYSLAEITSPVALNGAPADIPAISLSYYDSGRIYISLNNELTQLGTQDWPQPNPNNINAPNKNVRYQYFEATVKPDGNGDTNLWTNLTYIDFTAISLSLELFNASTAANSPQHTIANGLQLVKAMAGTTASGQSNLFPSDTKILPDPSFARLLAPNISGQFYHDWTYFLKTVMPGKTASIKGLFAGRGDGPWTDVTWQRQTYDFTASFDANGDVTLTANAGSGDGQVAAIPADLRGSGVGSTNQTITMTFDQLNDIAGIYGNNPHMTINQNGSLSYPTGLPNNVFGWVVGDLLAGICFGFVGSTATFNGTPIGEMDSVDWWGGLRTDGTQASISQTPAGREMVFSRVQPDRRNYHLYSATLLKLTPAYGFPLQDRLDKNLMTYNAWTDQNGYVRVTINPDQSATIAPIMTILD